MTNVPCIVEDDWLMNPRFFLCSWLWLVKATYVCCFIGHIWANVAIVFCVIWYDRFKTAVTIVFCYNKYDWLGDSFVTGYDWFVLLNLIGYNGWEHSALKMCVIHNLILN